MNQIMLIGNLTRDPETRTVSTGKNVCSFNIAVNRRFKSPNQPDTDFFRISAWGAMGENCQKYLAKGRKVCVVGRVSAHAFTGNDGQPKASLEVFANEVEFLTSRAESTQQDSYSSSPDQSTPDTTGNGFTEVDDTDLPF